MDNNSIMQWSVYDEFVYTLLTDPSRFIPMSKRLLGNRPYSEVNGVLRFNKGAADVVETLFTVATFFDPSVVAQKTSPEGRIFLQELTSKVQFDLGLYIPDKAFEDITTRLKEQYVKDAFVALAQTVKAKMSKENFNILHVVGNWEVDVKKAFSADAGLKMSDQLVDETIELGNSFVSGDRYQAVLPFLLDGLQHGRNNVLDHVIGGMPRGDVVVIAGETGSGKSALAEKIAFNNALFFQENKLPLGVLVISMEMDGKMWIARHASGLAQADLSQARRGDWDQNDPNYQEWDRQVRGLRGLPFSTVDRAGLNALEVKDYLDMLTDKVGGVGIVVWDFARLGSANAVTRDETKRVESIFYDFRDLVRNYSNPDGSRPVGIMISELRESDPPYVEKDLKYGGDYAGSLIMMIVDPFKHRNSSSYSFKNALKSLNIDKASIASSDRWINVAKDRHGSPGIIREISYIGQYTDWQSRLGWSSRVPNKNKKQGVNL